jgi:lysyl-tRNA synthetase class 2
MEPIKEILAQRLQKLESLRQEGIDPYPRERWTQIDSESIRRRFGHLSSEELERLGEVVSVAGRIMAQRDFGKSVFLSLLDRKGRIQVYVRKDVLREPAYEIFRRLDIGDIIGASGKIFRTKTGELTVLAERIKLLTKSLRPLPEKWHGLKDTEERYRKRYLDLIMNESVREVFLKRAAIIDYLRAFLKQRDFLEVETPMMHVLPGGATARPFVTHHNALDMDLFLRIAPELYLKRLIVGGFERVFEMNRNFRNEGVSSRHNPEFTMLEFYQAYATYEDLMELTEQMISSLVHELYGAYALEWNGLKLDFTPPWRRVRLRELLEHRTGLSADDTEGLLEFAEKRGVSVKKTEKKGKILFELFEHFCEDSLIQPTFVTHYPIEVSPLAKRSKEDEGIAERFELYILGMEVANGFNELNDPFDQRKRFEEQVREREEGATVDEDYLCALEYGLPPTAGEGIGIDRLTMVLTGSTSVREVILFPLLRP